MSIITINETKCNTCSICVQSCPLSLIETQKESKKPFISESRASQCIYCGHCESICPEGALTHELSEKAMASASFESTAIKPTELGAYFRNRRSIRKYMLKQADKAVLEEMMDVIRYAPTGTNQQKNQWVVVSNPDIIKQLADGTIEWMKSLVSAKADMATRYNLPGLIMAYQLGNDIICRNAPHLFICYAPTAHPAGRNDAVIAAAQLDLLLPSYGMGGCWAGFLMIALQNSPALKQVIGLGDESTVHAALMAGYPKFKYYKIPARNKAAVTWM